MAAGFDRPVTRSANGPVVLGSKLQLVPTGDHCDAHSQCMAAIEDINQQPIVHTWSYNLETAA